MKIQPTTGFPKQTIENATNQKAQQSFQKILNKVEAEKENKSEAKLKDVCQQLESVFVHKMISQMRSAIPQGGYMEKSNGEEIFQDMLDEEYAKKISKTGGIGLADMLYKQLSATNDKIK